MNYIVDVPVLLFVFNRPKMLEKVFNVIKIAKPSVLFLVSDGPRLNIPNEAELVNQSRMIVEEINWNCKIYKLYSNENKGLYKTMWEAFDYIFSLYDRCIVLEDDVVPSVSFFKFTADLLEKYKNDDRIQRVSGMNFLSEYPLNLKSDYFFAKEASIWGFGFWKRVYLDFDRLHEYGDSEYIRNQLKLRMPKSRYAEFLNYYIKKESHGHPPGLEYFFGIHKYLYNTLSIIPTKNMISNIGVGDNSTNSNELVTMPKGQRKMFLMKIYEMDLMKYNNHVIDDIKYSKKVTRITSVGHPVISLYRKIILIIKILVFKGPKAVYLKFKKKRKKNHGK